MDSFLIGWSPRFVVEISSGRADRYLVHPGIEVHHNGFKAVPGLGLQNHINLVAGGNLQVGNVLWHNQPARRVAMMMARSDSVTGRAVLVISFIQPKRIKPGS